MSSSASAPGKPASSASPAARLAAAVRRGGVAEVERLLSEGEIVNQRLGRGHSALHLAAQRGHLLLAQLLLRRGAEVDIVMFERIASCDCGAGGAEPRQVLGPAPADLPRSPLRPRGFDAIDLAPFVWPERYSDEARQRSARSWDESFRTVGFAVIEGHGVAPELVEDLRTAATAFFRAPSDYKHRYFRGPQMTGRSGYSPVGAANAGHSDPVEGYMFMRYQAHGWMNPTEKHPDELNGIGQRYCNEIERVMHALHRMSAMALGLEESYFEPFFKDPASVLVVSNYPPLRPPPPQVKIHEGKLRYRAHSDYTGFTILMQDETDFDAAGGGGLEIDIEGEWVPVKPKKDCFVINIGDLFETWTNDRWRSTPHRVVSPKLSTAAAARNRLTVMLFSGPALDAIIAPISTCVDDEHPARYPAVPAADHLRGVYKTKSKEAVYKHQLQR